MLVESSYEQGDKFIPERWYSKPEMVKDDSGFSPFSMGIEFSIYLENAVNKTKDATIA